MTGMSWTYGPWSAPTLDPCGHCTVQADPQGHRLFVAWDWACPSHGLEAWRPDPNPMPRLGWRRKMET